MKTTSAWSESSSPKLMKVKRTYPTLTYTDQLTFYHGGREFRFSSMVGDADGTTVLYLPKEKILVTGDVLSYPVPYFTTPRQPPRQESKNTRPDGCRCHHPRSRAGMA